MPCGSDTHVYKHAHGYKRTYKHKQHMDTDIHADMHPHGDIDTQTQNLFTIPNRVACSSCYHHFHRNSCQHQHDNDRFGCVVGRHPTSHENCVCMITVKKHLCYCEKIKKSKTNTNNTIKQQQTLWTGRRNVHILISLWTL